MAQVLAAGASGAHCSVAFWVVTARSRLCGVVRSSAQRTDMDFSRGDREAALPSLPISAPAELLGRPADPRAPVPARNGTRSQPLGYVQARFDVALPQGAFGCSPYRQKP